jgi:diacylglycerol kinase family enzyme
METLEKLQVLKDSKIPTEIILTSNYIFWKINTLLECFHLDYLTSVSFSSMQISLTVYDEDLFKTFSFLSLSCPSFFVRQVQKMTFPRPRHFHILFNPYSGNNRSQIVLEKILVPLLKGTLHTFEIEEITENLPGFSPDIQNLIILGGDGTVHLVLSYLFMIKKGNFQDFYLGVVPTGTRNSLAIDLSGRSLNLAIFYILRGKCFKADLMKVKMDEQVVIATTSIFWGLTADIPKAADDLKSLGKFRFLAAILGKLFEKWSFSETKVTMYSPKGLTFKSSEFAGVFIGNNKAKNWTNDELPYPKASLTDGFLDTLLVNQCGKLWALFLFLQLANGGGNHLKTLNVIFPNH